MLIQRLREALFLAFGAALATAGVSGVADARSVMVLYSFAGGSDGAFPTANVIADQAGNLYGTTQFGGGMCGKSRGCGTAFKLAPDGTETVLYAFRNRQDGGWPTGGLVLDSQGNLYGTTQFGGKPRCGTVFEVAPSGVETVLHAFQCNVDGEFPQGGLVSDQAGNLYGTTFQGGGCSYCGTVFEISSTGVYSLLYSFKGGNDGAEPAAPLIFDAAGNLYGTTEQGGGVCGFGQGCGTAFELTGGTETVLYAFQGGRDGWIPYGALALSLGNLYGTTVTGGGNGCGGSGCGTVFQIAGGSETVLSRFNRSGGPSLPSGDLVLDQKGDLLGTSGGGSANCGAVFEVAPGRQAKAIHTFTCGSDGAYPAAGLVQGANGVLYGTTENGGKSNLGTVFALQ